MPSVSLFCCLQRPHSCHFLSMLHICTHTDDMLSCKGACYHGSISYQYSFQPLHAGCPVLSHLPLAVRARAHRACCVSRVVWHCMLHIVAVGSSSASLTGTALLCRGEKGCQLQAEEGGAGSPRHACRKPREGAWRGARIPGRQRQPCQAGCFRG